MEISTTQTSQGETILTLSGQLNFRVRKELQNALNNAQTEGTNQVILDFTNTTSIDCAALGILVRAKEECTKAHIMLSLLATPGPVLDVLHTMKIDKILTIVPAKHEA